MAYIEDRKRKNGTVTYYVRWIDPHSKQGMAQKVDSEDSAKLLLTVLKAHAYDIDSALESVKAHYRGVYTVSRMIENHISLLTVGGSGATVECFAATLLTVSGRWTPQKSSTETLSRGSRACRPRAWHPRRSKTSTA